MSDVRPPARGGLGRGLGALIPRAPSGLQEIDVDRIAPSPRQPRLRFDEASLAELADSIRQHGLLQPIVVARLEAEGGGEGYVLVAGERRWRAARLAGLASVPAIVKNVASRQRLELALVENLQREDLTPLETAAAYRELIDEHQLTQEQIAQRVGRGRSSITNTLRLLQLPRAAREALVADQISEGHARALLGAPDEASLLACLAATVSRGLSVRQTEQLVRRAAEPPASAASAQATTDPAAEAAGAAGSVSADLVETAYLEERLRQALGTRVQLQRARNGGRLVIHFFSDDQLEGLLDRLCRE